MDDGSVRKVWSEAELDEALADLHAEPEVRQDELSRARAALLRAAGEVEDELVPVAVPPAKKRPGSWRWIAAAAAAALVSGGGIVAANAFTGGDGPDPAAHSITAPGDDVLDALRGDDFPLRVNQYRLVTESTWTTHVTKSGLVYQTHEITERWLSPHTLNLAKKRVTTTGEIRWIKGDYQSAQGLGEALPGPSTSIGVDEIPAPTTTSQAPPTTTTTGPPPPIPSKAQLRPESGWTNPTVEFLADLPTDPAKMAERLLRDSTWRDDRTPERLDAAHEMFRMAFTVLRSSQGFGAQRVALCKALARMPGITTESTVTDGRPALSFSVASADQTRTFIVDVATAAVVRNRAVRARTDKDWPGLTLFDTAISVVITDAGGPPGGP
ncbi:CU044_5270 family protein [Amycolatopsis orientalis]|uniref:CU044_5270 family protein n=1 Tax=Amycolatopsis orientalis TaxID=31958 RepID=UPI000A52D973|nr:CU044_5270 family protein [Amycolatopsis orientalis]